MSLTDCTKPTDVALNTDLYELTMAQGFWESGFTGSHACFNVFFRENPFGGGYAVSCGTAQIQDLVENFVFDDEAVELGVAPDPFSALRLFQQAEMGLRIDIGENGLTYYYRRLAEAIEGQQRARDMLDVSVLD